MQFENSDELMRYISARTGGQTILGFSTGKDSIAAWLVMRKYFTRIVPVYMYNIPGLRFVEESLEYYENYFDTKIIRLPNPSLYRQLNNLTFQAPENCRVIEEMDLPNFEIWDVNKIVEVVWGLPQGVYTASGVRARDSLNRWTAIKKYGPVNENRKTFYPIFDFTKAMMVRTLQEEGIKLPVDYRMFGRSYDGLDYRFMIKIQKYYPADFERIKAFFPLVELEMKRIEFRAEFYSQLGGA